MSRFGGRLMCGEQVVADPVRGSFQGPEVFGSQPKELQGWLDLPDDHDFSLVVHDICELQTDDGRREQIVPLCVEGSRVSFLGTGRAYQPEQTPA